MADKETEQEWAKLRRIEAEKEKARRALEGEKPDARGLAYIGPQKKKTRGWSVDEELLIRKAEKLSTWSVILALFGVVLGIISAAGGVVSIVNQLGMAGMMISGIPGGVSFLCFGLAIVFALIAVCVELYYKFRRGHKFGVSWWSAVVAIAVILIYVFVKIAIMQYH